MSSLDFMWIISFSNKPQISSYSLSFLIDLFSLEELFLLSLSDLVQQSVHKLVWFWIINLIIPKFRWYWQFSIHIRSAGMQVQNSSTNLHLLDLCFTFTCFYAWTLTITITTTFSKKINHTCHSWKTKLRITFYYKNQQNSGVNIIWRQ